jgi:hypothetical protein
MRSPRTLARRAQCWWRAAPAWSWAVVESVDSGFVRVLESAARLQEVVPDAVLVGRSAAALWANHGFSYDHDHVLQDLSDRFDAVLEAIEATDGWVTNRVTRERSSSANRAISSLESAS